MNFFLWKIIPFCNKLIGSESSTWMESFLQFAAGIFIYIFSREFLQYLGSIEYLERFHIISQTELSSLTNNLKSDVNLWFHVSGLKQDHGLQITKGRGLPSCLDLDKMVSNCAIIFPHYLYRFTRYFYFLEYNYIISPSHFLNLP